MPCFTADELGGCITCNSGWRNSSAWNGKHKHDGGYRNSFRLKSPEIFAGEPAMVWVQTTAPMKWLLILSSRFHLLAAAAFTDVTVLGGREPQF